LGGETAKGGRPDRRLLELFGRLDSAQQDKLIAFAEFLAADEPDAGGGPAVIERPDRETVTMAIRRLVRSYPMLDRRRLMAESSRLMAQHALEGRPANEVIDELEAVFARHFQRHKAQGTRDKGAK
jgi:hypothetical protein